MSYVKLERTDITVLCDWLERAEPLIERVESRLPSAGPTRRVSVRMLFAGLLATAVHERSVHLRRAVDQLNRLTKRDTARLKLGSYDRATYRAFQHTFSLVAHAMDPYDANTADPEAAARLNEDVVHYIIAASVPPEFAHHPHLAIDTTQTSSWAAPPSSLDSSAKERAKVTSAERKAQAAPTKKQKPEDVAAEIIEDAIEAARVGRTTSGKKPWGDTRGQRATGYDLDDYEPPQAAAPSFPDYGTQTGPYDCASACWIGNKNPRKAVYGHGVHVTVMIPGRGEDPDAVPLLATGARVTATTANPHATQISMLCERQRRFHDDGHTGFATGDLAADNAFFPDDGSALAVKALGAEPIFHLHAINQQGPHRPDARVIWIDGRPYCPCIPERLRRLKYPRFPHQFEQRANYRRLLDERDEYEFKPMGNTKADGSRRFFTAHKGECKRCVDSAAPCCTTQTVTFSAQDLAVYQHEVFGSKAWADSYGRRALVEGFFGVLKTVTGLRGDNARFHHHGKVSLAYAFMICATNLRLLETWRRRQALKKANPDAAPRRDRRRAKYRAIQDFSPIEPDDSPRPAVDQPKKPPGPLDFLDELTSPPSAG